VANYLSDEKKILMKLPSERAAILVSHGAEAFELVELQRKLLLQADKSGTVSLVEAH
jgi:hypothetical protein